MLNLIEQTIKENKEIKVTKNIKARAKKWFLIKKNVFLTQNLIAFFTLVLSCISFVFLLAKMSLLTYY